MIEVIGGAMMMAGGGMLTASSVVLARAVIRRPVGTVGVALDEAYPAAAPVPADMAALLDRLP